MPCYRVPMKDGGKAFLCGDLGPHCTNERCEDVGGFLCDYPVGRDKTCDLALCESHAYEISPDLHYCHAHMAMWSKFKADGGENKLLENVEAFGVCAAEHRREAGILAAENEKLRRLLDDKNAEIERLRKPAKFPKK